MNTKVFSKFFATLVLTLAATMSYAAIPITGVITNSTGLLKVLVPVGSPTDGTFDWSTYLEGGTVEVTTFCFSELAVGFPKPTSVNCPSTVITVPILATGQTSYDGTANPPGSHFEQAGTTFDGTSGVLEVLTYSPTFFVNISITINFNANGTGTLHADGGLVVGTADADFTW
jgi:hypothetical protein